MASNKAVQRPPERPQKMQASMNRARYEKCLARAAMALHDALLALDQINDPGAVEDCMAIRTEVGRLMEDSVRGKKRRLRQQELSA